MAADTAHMPIHEHGRAAPSSGVWPLVTLWLIVPAVIAALMAYYLALSRRVIGESGFPLDDGWIHVRFAQNLARGEGFSFNPGVPASTTTAPLWTLLLALGYRVTGEYFLTSAALSWLICCLSAGTVSSLAQTFVPRRDFGAAVALVFAVTIPLPWLALSGMEPPLFIWLALLGILLHVRHRRSRGAAGLAPTAVLGLAALARPECLLLFPLAMLDRLLMSRWEGAGRPGAAAWLKQLAVHLPVFAAVVAPMFVYNYRVIGRPLPSSFYIKAMNYGVTWALAMGDDRLLAHCLLAAPAKAIGLLLALWATNNIVLIVPFLVGIFCIVRRAGGEGRDAPRSLLIPLVLAAQPIAWAIATDLHRAPAFQSQRYVANLGPLYLIVGMAGLWSIIRRLGMHLRSGVTVGAVALVLLASLVRHGDQSRLYVQNVKNITELQVATARWIEDHLPADAVLAVNDVGAIGVITGCRVHDMIGLVSPETLACLTLENARHGTWRQCTRQAFIAAEPDYMVVNAKPERLDGLLRRPDLQELVYEAEIEDNITAGGAMMLVFRTIWCKHPPEGMANTHDADFTTATRGLGQQEAPR